MTAFKNFCRCGLAGWCMEILYTSLGSHLCDFKNTRFIGHTSLWMFPIYGSAVIIRPLSKRIRNSSFLTRGLIYMLLIYLTEFVSGKILKHFHSCPWNYRHVKCNLCGLVRLDFAPLWFLCGLFYEHFLDFHHNSSINDK